MSSQVGVSWQTITILSLDFYGIRQYKKRWIWTCLHFSSTFFTLDLKNVWTILTAGEVTEDKLKSLSSGWNFLERFKLSRNKEKFTFSLFYFFDNKYHVHTISQIYHSFYLTLLFCNFSKLIYRIMIQVIFTLVVSFL